MDSSVEPERISWAQLRELFVDGAFSFDERFGGDDALARQIALRTTVYLDGDVIAEIDARALARPDFAELLARHHARVRCNCTAYHRKVTRGLEWTGRVLGLLPLLSYSSIRSVSAAPVAQLEALLQFKLPTMYVEVLNLALVSGLGLVIAIVLPMTISRDLIRSGGRRSIYPQS